MTTPLGEQFAEAIAKKDGDALRSILSDDVDFKAMTPGRFWEPTSHDEIVEEVIFGKWFEPTDHIDEIQRIEHDSVEGRHRVAYRYTVTNSDGTHTVEQQAYYDVDGEQITWIRIMCAGYRPVSA
jgi:hypothetical protein